VVGSRSPIGALERAARAGVPTRVIPPQPTSRPSAVTEPSATLLAALDEHRIDLVVLAGYLKLLPTEVVNRYRGRMLNIHPALLPAFGGPGMYGLKVHQAVLAAGVRVTGATVHFVDERYDEGAILAQWPVPVYPWDTPETLSARVLQVEHRLLPAAIETLLPPAAHPRPGLEGAFDLVDAGAPPEESIRRLLSTEGR
jgi:phosphoribosylglycinamide formyltransferase-1